jgi:flagellin
MDFTLDPAMAAGSTTSFVITGGGAKFQLGARVSSNQQVSIGIGSVAATSLGTEEVGFLNTLANDGPNSLASNPTQAGKILELAITQVATLRGRLGAFEKNTLDTNISSLQVALENVTSSESSIRDADFAAETSAMTRAQILTQAGTSVLATANSTPQQVLSLLQH